MSRRLRATVLSLVVGLAACGPLPPQAQLPYAQKLDSATSGISTACGEAFEVTAFPGAHRHDLDQLEGSASTDVRKLLIVFKRDPNWVYQGETVAQIAGASEQMLSSCGLNRAGAELKRATS